MPGSELEEKYQLPQDHTARQSPSPLRSHPLTSRPKVSRFHQLLMPEISRSTWSCFIMRRPIPVCPVVTQYVGDRIESPKSVQN